MRSAFFAALLGASVLALSASWAQAPMAYDLHELPPGATLHKVTAAPAE